jgi:protein-tyrosine phosphatase
MAHGIMQQLIEKNNLDWVVESAGTNGLHTGEPPHKSSIKICLENGIDISKQISQPFLATDFDNYDKIYVMAKDVYADVLRMAKHREQMEKVTIFLNVLYPASNRDVVDPWYGGDAGYKPVFEEIKKACEQIVALERT